MVKVTSKENVMGERGSEHSGGDATNNFLLQVEETLVA